MVSDGTAVLGLGDIGPRASLPVMEGKSALFKKFAGLNSIPLVLDTKDPDEIVETLIRLRPSFGAVNLEDISAPRCFEIEKRVIEALDCPVMHDDQHGTAIVVLAALKGAVKVQGRDIAGPEGRHLRCRRGRCGLREHPARRGHPRRRRARLEGHRLAPTASDLNEVKADLAARTNPRGLTGGAAEALAGADVFLGVSAGTIPEELIASMAPEAIVFALSNPDPEIHPDVARQVRGDRGDGPQRLPEPDQQCARLPRRVQGCARCRCPPHHRGHEARRRRGNPSVSSADELAVDKIVPSPLDPRVAPAVAEAVAEAARAEGVA